MKTNQVKALVAGTMLWAGLVLGQSSTNFLFNVNQAIPDDNPLGLTLTTNLAVAGGSIGSVTVGLDISGGYNGDLYAYVAGPNGGFSVLLNRVGVSNNASAFGYSDGGFNVTFSDSAGTNIQYYQSFSYTLSGGQLTGVWQPEGVNIDPQSSPSSFFGAPQSALLGSFDGSNPNGTWTLFLADLSGGGQSTLVGWTADIVTVPEPGSWALLGLGLLGTVVMMRRRTATR